MLLKISDVLNANFIIKSKFHNTLRESNAKIAEHLIILIIIKIIKCSAIFAFDSLKVLWNFDFIMKFAFKTSEIFNNNWHFKLKKIYFMGFI